MRSPGDDVARVVGVHEAANLKGISQRLGATRCLLLFNITVEFLPIRTVVEQLVFYVWLLGIEYQTELGVALQEHHYSVQRIKVAFPRVCLILGQYRDLIQYIESIELYGPTENPNYLAVDGRLLVVELRCGIELWLVVCGEASLGLPPVGVLLRLEFKVVLARVEINCNWKTTATERRLRGKARTNLTKVRHETADDVELLWPPLPKYRIIQDNKVMRNHLHLILLNSAHSDVNDQVSEFMSYSDQQIRGSIALLLRSTVR